jgi:hypothetical protein
VVHPARPYRQGFFRDRFGLRGSVCNTDNRESNLNQGNIMQDTDEDHAECHQSEYLQQAQRDCVAAVRNGSIMDKFFQQLLNGNINQGDCHGIVS